MDKKLDITATRRPLLYIGYIGFIVVSLRRTSLRKLMIDIYIFKEVIVPLTENSGWYGLVDKIAVGFYVLGGLIMVALGVISFNFFGNFLGERFQKGLRVGLLSAFLVISHVAMIAGMADPRLDSDYRILTEEKSSFSESVMSEVSSSVHIHEHHH